MDCVKTRAIVARRADYSESNCMLTLYAEGLGVISACVYGVKSKKSRLRAAAQPLCFAEFVLERAKDGIFRVEAAEVAEAFYPISEDIEKLALSGYFLEITGDILSAEDDAPLFLLLNTLYALAYKSVDLCTAKAVFELKAAQYSGYEPELSACVRCGADEGISGFSLDGGAVCENCRTRYDAELSESVKMAASYILNADKKRLFSFSVSDSAKKSLSRLCESYFLDKSDKRYKTLEYYKKLKGEDT